MIEGATVIIKAKELKWLPERPYIDTFLKTNITTCGSRKKSNPENKMRIGKGVSKWQLENGEKVIR